MTQPLTLQASLSFKTPFLQGWMLAATLGQKLLQLLQGGLVVTGLRIVTGAGAAVVGITVTRPLTIHFWLSDALRPQKP